MVEKLLDTALGRRRGSGKVRESIATCSYMNLSCLFQYMADFKDLILRNLKIKWLLIFRIKNPYFSKIEPSKSVIRQIFHARTHLLLEDGDDWYIFFFWCVKMSNASVIRQARSEFDAGKHRIAAASTHALACCFHPSRQASSQYLPCSVRAYCLTNQLRQSSTSHLDLIFNFVKLSRLYIALVLHERIYNVRPYWIEWPRDERSRY